MPDASDEQTWWSNLFTGGADTGLEIPDGIWESVVAATFEIDTQPPADQLLPTDQVRTVLMSSTTSRTVTVTLGTLQPIPAPLRTMWGTVRSRRPRTTTTSIMKSCTTPTETMPTLTATTQSTTNFSEKAMLPTQSNRFMP